GIAAHHAGPGDARCEEDLGSSTAPMKVTVRAVTKRFSANGRPAVFDASFTATSGAITTLLGPSGSGKTTLLRVVAGLELADSGQVFFDDQDMTRVPARARSIGFVFQA